MAEEKPSKFVMYNKLIFIIIIINFFIIIIIHPLHFLHFYVIFKNEHTNNIV